MARTPASVESYDLVILGSGSTAFAAAIRAAELGKTAAMTESRTLGGTCVNRGCLPSKNMIEAARIYWEAHHPRYPGLRPRGMDLNFKELVRQKDGVIHDYRDKKYQSIVLDSDRIKVYTGRAAFTRDGAVEINGRRLVGRQYLIATGSRPVVPPIEGLDAVPYLTSDLLTSEESQELWELPKSLVIVGGGYIALELAQMFQRAFLVPPHRPPPCGRYLNTATRGAQLARAPSTARFRAAVRFADPARATSARR